MRNLRRSRVVRRVFSALLCMALLIGSINVSGLTARADIGNDPEQPVYTLTEPAPSEDGQIQELPDVTNHAQEDDIVNFDENNGTLVPENPTQAPEEPGEDAGEEQTTPEENPEEGQTLPEENPEQEPAPQQEQPDAADEEPGAPEVNPEQVPEASGENPEQGQTASEVNPEQGQTAPEENKDQDPAPQQDQTGAAEVTPDAPEVNPEQVPETPAENPEQEQPVPADGAGNEGQNLPAELPQNAEGSDAGKTEEQLSEENTSNEETEENAEIDYDALSEALEDTWMITAGERVNVREIPNAEGGIVAVIKEKGARVQVLARYTEDWLKIRIAAEDAELPAETADESAAETMDYVTGYVRADLLREERKYSYDADDLGNHEELEDMDFSARRLIVAIDDSDEIVEEESVLAVYEPVADAADDTPVYLLSFDTEEKTKIAYLHYLDEAEFAEPDVALFVTDRSDDAAQEDADDAQKKEARRADEGTDASEDDDADPENETPDYELPEFGASDQSQEENAFDLLTEEMEKLLAEQEEQEEERRRRKEAEEEAPHGMEDEDASEEAEDEAEEEEDESPVIALLSTGVGSESGSYEALARRVNFVPDGDDYDLNGNGTGLYGILTEEAEDAKILSVSVLDEDGRGDLSMLYAGILYAAQYGADYIVLPMTAYLPDGSEALRSALRFAEDKDITVIAAAGDFAEDAEDFVPASYGAVITAGAAKENGARRRASNYGSDVDVNVVAVDTAEAAARLAGILCREGITAEDFEELTLNEGAVFETGYVPPEKDLYARTTAEKVNVRAQASTDSDIVAVIGQKGTRVQVLYIIEQEDVWYRVRLLPNGKTQTADDAAQEGDTGEEDEDAEESVEGYIRSDLAELIEGDGAGYLYTEEELEALEEADFTAKRLIVSIPETEIVEEESVLAVYTPDVDESDEEGGLPVYLLQFDTEEEAKIAYLHYGAFAAFAEPDRTMRAAVIAESASAEDDMSETASGDAEESCEISMSEDVNPLTVLEDLLEELEEKRAADREAAEQETQNEAPIRQQEDADTSSEHSQERRAVRQQEDGDEEVPSDEAEADNAPEDAAGDETVSGSDTAEITAEDTRKETHTVAVLTSGVGAASASYRNLAGRVSLLGDDGHDTNGQGTRLYETILNAADNAQILPVKVLDENGEGAVSAVYAGILYAAQYGAEYLVLPVTMYTPETSGLSEQSAALRSAIDLACEAGITVIAAAGDHGADAADFMPASADRVITAGSAAEDGLRRETSNYGDDVDVNVTSQTTGEAAARLAGILCAEEITADTISDLKTNLYGGAVFTTSFTEADLRYPGGVLRAEESGCEITLTYDENAMIVPDAELRVKELTTSDSGDAAESNADSYESMLALAMQAAGEDGSPEKNLPENVRLFKLQIVRTAEDGTEQEIISRAPVAIGIAPGDMKADSKEEDVSVVRFVTENDVLQAVKVEGISVSDQISFTQEQGTGTYGVFYNGGAKPAFHEIKEVDGIRISVQAEEGVFPEGATLSVTKIEVPDAASGTAPAQDETDAQQVLDEVEKAVSSVRGKNRNVALSQTFDIKVLSRSGVEIQPTDAAKVKVSFTMAAVENKNLDMQVYHLAEPQKQSGTESADTVEQSADENPEASAEPAENANENAEETESENAESEATEVQTEQDAAADVPAEEGIYRAESLEVVTDGSTATVETESFSLYTVEFTYGELVYVMKGGTKLPLRTIMDTLGLVGTPTAVETSNRALLSASNKSGEWIVTSYQAFNTEEWMKVTIDGIVYEIVVTDAAGISLDYSKLQSAPNAVYSNSYGTTSFNNNKFQPNGFVGQNVWDSASTDPNNYIRLRYGDSGNWKNLATDRYYDYSGNSTILVYSNAATTSDGSLKDVVVTYENIKLYLPTTGTISETQGNSRRPTVTDTFTGVSLDTYFTQANTPASLVYGIEADINIKITEPGTNTPVSGGFFVFKVEGIDCVRENGTPYAGINGASAHNNFSESVTVVSGSVGEVLSLPDGLAVKAQSSGITVHAVSSGSRSDPQTMSFIQSYERLSRTISSATGDHGFYEVYDVDDNNTLLYRGTEDTSFEVDDDHAIKYVLTADRGYVIDTLIVDGSAVAVPADSTSYEFTIPGDADSHVMSVSWIKYQAPPVVYQECDDCKNPAPCNDCYNALNGRNLNGYVKSEGADGAYRGGNATSKLQGKDYYLDGETAADNTFASALPYGNIFIDTSYLQWTSANKDNFEIDIKDPRFQFVGKTPIEGHPYDEVLTAEAGENLPTIAYYGPVHSYLMYGTEKAETAPANASDTRRLGKYSPTNITASTENIASGVYTVTEDDTDYSVTLDNGRMVIEPDGTDYLYRVTYKNAAVLEDGTRGNLVLTTTKVEMESSYTTEGRAYIALQKANEMTVNTTYINPKTSKPYIPRGEGVIAQDGVGIPENSDYVDSARNAFGEKITFEVAVTRPDGTLVDGVLAYGVKDLDFPSYQSIWGRQPTDTYAGNGGTDPAIAGDPVRNAWTGTHEFYEFPESMSINSGALSPAFIPSYTHDRSNYTANLYNDGQLPVNRLLYYQKNEGMFAGKGLDDILYAGPLKVIEMPGKAPGDSTANGLHFVCTDTMKYRNNSGTFTTAPLTGNGTSNGYFSVSTNGKLDKYYTKRGDDKTYDSGFAVLLSSAGSELTWSASYITSGNLNTDLFDSGFASYLVQSHGTGGGIHLENYTVDNNCEPVFIEGVAVFGVGATATVSVVPEDGYRVKQIHIDNKVMTIDEENNTIDIDGTIYSLPAGGSVTESSLITSRNTTPIEVTVVRYADGTYDVKLPSVKAGTSIHADFDTDYYFQKVWDGVKTVPDQISFSAVPYVVTHDSVKIGNQTYKIETLARQDESQQTYYAQVYTNVADPTDTYDVSDDRFVVVNSTHYNTVELGPAGNKTRYAIVGNRLQAVTKEDNMWRLTGWPYDISTVLGRYSGDNISEQTFTVNSSQVTVDTTSQPGKTIWKIKYPASGDAAKGWPALPIEADGMNKAGGGTNTDHNSTENHVERIYWFANEDLSSLNQDWILKSYDNIDNGQVEMPGLVSNSKFKDTMWYTLATQDHSKINSSLKYMSDILLAAMTPINYDTADYQGNTPYAGAAGYGGIVTNHSIETKLKVVKVWQGDQSLTEAQREEFREKLTLNIHRDYIYAQPRFNDVPDTETKVTFNAGPLLNAAMAQISGGAANIRAFRRGVEPSTEQKINSITAANLSSATVGDTIIADDNTTESRIYLWADIDPATGDAFISYWTAADNTFLNQNSSQMFKNFKNLDDISGMFGVNSTKVRNMSEMFCVETNDGSLKNLDYLREFDTTLLENLNHFLAGQAALTDISGIIDWNVSHVPEDTTNNFQYMFAGTQFLYDDSDPNNVKETFPFVYFPNARVDTAGKLVDSDGNEFVRSGIRADSDDIVYMVSKDFDSDTTNDNQNNGEMVIEVDFVPGAAARTDDSTITFNSMPEPDARAYRWTNGSIIYLYTSGTWCAQLKSDEVHVQKNIWIWSVDNLLRNSDPSKWDYTTFENDIERYTVTNVDENAKRTAVENNHAKLVLNPQTGYYEYTITNAYMPTLTVTKEVTGSIGSRDKYFKFEVKIENVAPGTILDLTNVEKYEETGTNDATAYLAKDIKEAHERDEDTDKDLEFGRVSADEQIATDWVVKDDDETVLETYKYAPAAWYKKDTAGNWSLSEPPANAKVKYSDIDAELAKQYAWEDETTNTVYTYIGPGWYPSEPGADATIMLETGQTVEFSYIDSDSSKKYHWEKDGKEYFNTASTWYYLQPSGIPDGATKVGDPTVVYDAANPPADAASHKWEKDGVVYEYVNSSWVTKENPPDDATLVTGSTVRYVEMNPAETTNYRWKVGSDEYYYRNGKWWTTNGSGAEYTGQIPDNAVMVTSSGSATETTTYDTISEANGRKFMWTDDAGNTYEYVPGHWYKEDTSLPNAGDNDPKTSVTVPSGATAQHIGRSGLQIVCTKDGTPTGSTISDGTANDKSGWATFYIYMQHGQKFNIEQLPSGATYTVKEYYEDYKPSVKITGDSKTNDGDDDDTNDKAIKLNQDKTAKTASINDTAIIDNTTIDYTNKRDATVPTEVRLGITAGLFGPIMMAILCLRFYLRRRRRRLVQYADGSVEEFYDDYEDDIRYMDLTSDFDFDIVE